MNRSCQVNGGVARQKEFFRPREQGVQSQKGRSMGQELREQGKHAGGEAGLLAEAGALCLLN